MTEEEKIEAIGGLYAEINKAWSDFCYKTKEWVSEQYYYDCYKEYCILVYDEI